MKPIKVLIADDEPAAVHVLSSLIKELSEDLVVVEVAMDGTEAMKAILKHKPELIFMDINMPFVNGLEVLEKLAFEDLKVIFTTGSDLYALRALKLKAVDYLLKPIDPADFMVAVQKAKKLIETERQLQLSSAGQSRVQFATQNGFIILEENNIIHIEGMGSYSQIATTDKAEKITVSRNIGQIEKKLSDAFFRCHNSHIVNLNYITSFSTKDGFSVCLKDGTCVDVSRRSKEQLLQILADKQIRI